MAKGAAKYCLPELFYTEAWCLQSAASDTLLWAFPTLALLAPHPYYCAPASVSAVCGGVLVHIDCLSTLWRPGQLGSHLAIH